MAAHRTGKVWGGKGVGWLSKREEEDATYENLGDGWPLFIALCRFWPDFLADILWDDEAPYDLALIQRAIMRVNARYRAVDVTGCRGLTKSFCNFLGKYEDSLLWPGIETDIFGPTTKQTAQIASKIYQQLEMCAPTLTGMLTVERQGEGVFVISTPYKSSVRVETFRGNSMHRVVAEETAQEDRRTEFDPETFKESVIPQVRLPYKVHGKHDPAFIRYSQHSITSAGRRQQYAYETRCRHLQEMRRGKSAFVMDVDVSAVLLCQMRDKEWLEMQKEEVGVSGMGRELWSIYSGNEKNPLIPEDAIDASRSLLAMEYRHCCAGVGCKYKPEDVIYVLGYDVSYRDSKQNAKCAIVVVKLTQQKNDPFRKDKYLKQVVWVEDWRPAETPTPAAQAQRVRSIFNRYCFEGSQTYIAVDAWQYGDGVLCNLMDDPGGGLSPLCCYEHREKTELEREFAAPCIYPIRAGGVGTTDPDSDMIRNAQMNFLNGNIRLLTWNVSEGVEEYRKLHRIRDDAGDYKISRPYRKTNELIQQIQNLRENPAGNGVAEKRISNHIQRDSWSALKYALRVAQILERSNLQRRQVKNPWKSEFKKLGKAVTKLPETARMRGVGRVGGRRF